LLASLYAELFRVLKEQGIMPPVNVAASRFIPFNYVKVVVLTPGITRARI
jgi:predicted thioredoxin/glutaredoxin